MAEPYETNKIPDHWSTALKRTIIGQLVAISGLRLAQRDTWLIHPRTRCFPKYVIAELTITDEEMANPGQQINSVLYMGFLEMKQGGVIIVGDSVSIAGKKLGVVCGFSDIHLPNHLNIMVKGDRSFLKEHLTPYPGTTVVKLEFNLEDEVRFQNERSE